jgi:flagellar hook-length control protein FliK
MTATKTSAPASTAPVQVGKGKEKANTNGFANLLSESIAKDGKGVKVSPALIKGAEGVPKQVLGEFTKGLGKLDLSHLGEVAEEEVDPKKGAIKLGDLLADLSHRSSAPVGSEVINLKTVLGSKNDDPNLISKDLLALVPKKDQAKVTKSLIEGAKQVLQAQLENRIPKNRVPKTLKGLLETAIRFNMVVSDIKLETLPQNKVTTKLMEALETKAKTDPKLAQMLRPPVAKHSSETIANGHIRKGHKLDKEASPLEQMLKGKEEDTPTAAKDITNAKVADLPVAAKAKSLERTKDKDKSKADTKVSELKADAKQSQAELLKTVAPVAQNSTLAQKNSPLEKLLTVEAEQESETVANKSSSESTTSTNNTQAKGDIAPVKADSLQVKMAEARQLVSQLSADVKEAMETYKPPFTKLSMKLTPERLGEIDVMMVQRGNNVHINLTSNGGALGILQQNSADLKEALSSAGLSDATMNFSSNGENRNQEQQQKHSTSEQYAEMAKLMEDLDELEIIVPKYV